jgi:hypothetical protein
LKLLATICFLFLTAAPALAWRRHDTRTVKDLAKTYTGLAVVLACDIPRRKKHVTDRQHRRRSRACIDPALLKRCGFCGSSRNMRVHHLNGDESDEDPPPHQVFIVAYISSFILRSLKGDFRVFRRLINGLPQT